MASLLDIDPWHLMADWFVSEDKCLDEDSCRIRLASEIDAFIGKIQSKYEELGIDRKPVVFLKNDKREHTGWVFWSFLKGRNYSTYRIGK